MAVPFDQRPDLIWFDGKLVPTSESKVSALTHGLHYASCVFAGERAYGGEIFKGTEHSERGLLGLIVGTVLVVILVGASVSILVAGQVAGLG